MLPQILQVGACWQMLLYQLVGRWRKQNLSPMSGTHDAGGVMHIHSNVAIGSQQRFAGMQTNTYPHGYALRPRMTGESVLYSHSSCNRISGTRKNDEEGISLRIHLVTMVLRKRSP